MNQDDIIRMANEADMQLAWIATVPGSKKMKVLCDFDQVQRLVEIAAAAEREACAKVCDELHWPWHMGDNSGPKECADAIRARGQT